MRVNGGNSHDSLKVASSVCQSDGNMSADFANSLKADEEDRRSDHAPLVQAKENEVGTVTATIETNLRRSDIETEVGSLSGDQASSETEDHFQKSRMEGLRRRLLMWRLSPESRRDDLENIYMLLFRFVGNGSQLALCIVGWLATREFVVLVSDPIIFAPWPVLLCRGEPCDSCQDTARVVVFCFSCPMTFHMSTSRATLAMRWTA